MILVLLLHLLVTVFSIMVFCSILNMALEGQLLTLGKDLVVSGRLDPKPTIYMDEGLASGSVADVVVVDALSGRHYVGWICEGLRVLSRW